MGATTSFAERLRSELGDYDIAAGLREQIDAWLRADRDFNTWFLVTTKRALRDDELIELLDGYRESQEVVEEAWEEFIDTRDPTMLLEGIAGSIERMKQLQTKL